jgi:uncharacterized protein (DUF2384 family)
MTLTQERQEVDTFSDRLGAACMGVALGPAELSRILPVSERTARRWLHGESIPRLRDRERALEGIVVLEELARVFTPQGAVDWLFAPNRGLDFSKPADLLMEGDYLPVLGAIEALGEGVFV